MELNNFLIYEIEITNFRGYKQKKFNFLNENNDISRFILLSGPNGYGKTTIIDAIEWCITGSIMRIKKDFLRRCNSSEKNQNSQNNGLLRHNSKGKEECRVSLYGKYNNENVTLIRTYSGLKDFDGINGYSNLRIECSNSISNIMEKVLDNLQKNFYDRNICSYDKNIELYTKGRNDIYSMFSGLFGEFRESKKISENLEAIKNVAKDKIKEVKTNITNLNEKIDILESENKKRKINEYKENGSIAIKIKEDIEIINQMSSSELEIYKKECEQKFENLNDIVHDKVQLKLKSYCDYLNKNIKLAKINELYSIIKDNEEILSIIKNVDFPSLKAEKVKLQNFKKASISQTNIITNEDELKKLNLSKGKLENILKEVNSIKEIKNRNQNTIESLQVQLSKYSSKSVLINAIRGIVDNIDGFNEYKQESDNCPLCGSKGYSNSELAKYAKEFLGETDNIRIEISKQIESIERENNEKIKSLKLIIEKEIQTRELEISNLLKDEIIASKCKQMFKTLEIKEETLNQVELIKTNLSNEVMNFNEGEIIKEIIKSNMNFLKEVDFQECCLKPLGERKACIDMLLRRLGDLESDMLMEELDNYGFDSLLIEIEHLKKVLNIIEFILGDEEVKKMKVQKIQLDESLRLLENGNNKVSKMISDINKIMSEFEIKETKRIVEPLDSFYRKIARNSNISNIYIEKAKSKNNMELMVKDNWGQKTVFANTLSTGQLSTLAIAIFLSRALLDREDNIPFYMMDDPIQSMDDLNILSFIDILRFELVNDKKESKFINQLIFSTCNKDLELLINHKMKSFGIAGSTFKFIDLAEVKQSNY
ncbi:MAG: AAA family ATPase [Clostridium sp.]|nr:AAA family ATPase [Clostridium sp.]MDU7085733.1 AAA family ATPase [Clostridium sp.]